MSNYNLKLPWPPSVNGYWKPFRNRIIISKRGRDYRDSIDSLMSSLGLDGEQISNNLSLSITLNPPTLRRYDIDNFNKSVFDALTHCGFWVDDEQVVSLSIKKGSKVKGGNVEISITLID